MSVFLLVVRYCVTVDLPVIHDIKIIPHRSMAETGITSIPILHQPSPTDCKEVIPMHTTDAGWFPSVSKQQYTAIKSVWATCSVDSFKYYQINIEMFCINLQACHSYHSPYLQVAQPQKLHLHKTIINHFSRVHTQCVETKCDGWTAVSNTKKHGWICFMYRLEL